MAISIKHVGQQSTSFLAYPARPTTCLPVIMPGTSTSGRPYHHDTVAPMRQEVRAVAALALDDDLLLTERGAVRVFRTRAAGWRKFVAWQHARQFARTAAPWFA